MFAIAAVSQNWGIGKDNRLLFHISADMKRFRELTEGKTVLMGRKTLQSLPGGKGLPRRRNIVLTANHGFTAPDAEIAHTPVQAVFTAGEEAAVIGGESVYPCVSGCTSPRSLPTPTPTPSSPIWTPIPAGRWNMKAKFLRKTASATSSWTTFPRRKRTIWLTCSLTAASRRPSPRWRISPI